MGMEFKHERKLTVEDLETKFNKLSEKLSEEQKAEIRSEIKEISDSRDATLRTYLKNIKKLKEEYINDSSNEIMQNAFYKLVGKLLSETILVNY